MASFQIEVTEEAKVDLSYDTASERKIIASEIREQLTHQPHVETKNRKPLRDNPTASWKLRVRKYRVFYDVFGKRKKRHQRTDAVPGWYTFAN